MKTATVRDLRNHYKQLLEWIAAGEEIIITQRGKSIARLSPAKEEPQGTVDWSLSPAFLDDRSNERMLSAEEVSAVISGAGGKW